MSLVATLICNPANPALDSTIVDGARAVLPEARPAHWLFDEVAVDIPFGAQHSVEANLHAIEQRLREIRGDLPIDIVVQPIGFRCKKLFLADMDSTMIGQECIDELAAFVGVKEHVAVITERAMRGDIAFEPALRERVALLKGLPAKVINEVIDRHIRLTPGGRTLVATMRAHGAFTCLVSGGFTLFTDRIAAMIGFDETHANTLALEGEVLAGTVVEPVFDRDAKRATLVSLRARLKLDKDETLVVGDGANDLDMILEAGLGVAFRAKPKIAAAAPARIDHGDLTALLYVQGYNQKEFVDA